MTTTDRCPDCGLEGTPEVLEQHAKDRKRERDRRWREGVRAAERRRSVLPRRTR